MSNEQILHLQAHVHTVGCIGFDPVTGELDFCEGVRNQVLEHNAQALKEIAQVWNELPAFIQEFHAIEEDNRRMRVALESVQASSMYAMANTTARSSNPVDYWQAQDD